MPRTKKQPKSFSSDFSFDQMPARARIRRHRYAHRVQFHPAPRGLLPYRFGQGPRADTARALRMGRGPCGQTPERAQRRLQTMKARRRCRSRRRPGAALRTASASSRAARHWQGFQLPLPSCRSSTSARGAIPSPFLSRFAGIGGEAGRLNSSHGGGRGRRVQAGKASRSSICACSKMVDPWWPVKRQGENTVGDRLKTHRF